MVGRIYPLLSECDRLHNINKNSLRLCNQSSLIYFCYLRIQRTMVSEQRVSIVDFTCRCTHAHTHVHIAFHGFISITH